MVQNAPFFNEFSTNVFMAITHRGKGYTSWERETGRQSGLEVRGGIRGNTL